MPDVVGFSEEGARRIVEAVRDQERAVTGPQSHRRRYPVGAATGADIGCRLKNSGTQSVLAGATTALTFDQEDYDTDTMHDTGSNTTRITFTTAGKYIVWFGYRADLGAGPPSAGSYQKAILYLGGSPTDHLDLRELILAVGSGSSYFAQMSLTIEREFTAAQYVEVFNNNADTASITISKQFFGARRVNKAG